jgi:hypothetical protein
MKTKELRQENEKLRQIIKDIFWMARRYAHGRHTYAPSTIRDAYVEITAMGIKINHDIVLNPPEEDEIGGMRFRSDWLDDTNIKEVVNENS